VTARVNAAEGGTNGAAVTETNSAGTSGDAWDGVNVPTGTSITFAAAAAYKGTRGYRVTPGTGDTAPSLRWSLTGWPLTRTRFYLRFPSLPAGRVDVFHVGDPGHALNLARVAVTAAGRFQVYDAKETAVFTATSALTAGTWYRVELIVVPGTKATNGTIRFAYAAADGAVVETFASTSANTGVGGALGRLYVGKLNGVWNADLDFDDLASDDQSATTFLGASAASGTPVVVDPTPPPAPIVLAGPAPDFYDAAVRSSLAIWYTVDATYNGAAVDGAADLRPIGGSITDTTKPGVRRTLTLELAPEPGLYDLLSPIGTTLVVTAHLRYTNQQVVDIPMGVFDVDTESMSVAGGSISLTAPDRWVRIQRARFIGPAPSTAGILVRDQLALLIKDAISPNEPVNVLATSQAVMPLVVWEKDRDKATIDLAASIGAWVYFDRSGVATIEDIPTSSADSQYWLIDASDDGVLIDLNRERTRTSTYNVVVVSSSATDGERFPVQYVWDDDPQSPTYAGPTSPMFASDTPFGPVTYYFDTPILDSVASARKAGLTILARTTGLALQATVTCVPNPARDAYDVFDAVTPPEVWGAAPRTDRFVADTVTHPLTVDSPQRIEARSSRTDEFVGGS
jgi:hypothetical protein